MNNIRISLTNRVLKDKNLLSEVQAGTFVVECQWKNACTVDS